MGMDLKLTHLLLQILCRLTTMPMMAQAQGSQTMMEDLEEQYLGPDMGQEDYDESYGEDYYVKDLTMTKRTMIIENP